MSTPYKPTNTGNTNIFQNKNKTYSFIIGDNIAIQPISKNVGFLPSFQTESPCLFIKVGYIIRDSPLKQLIEMGIIVKNGMVIINNNTYDKYQYYTPLIDTRGFERDSTGKSKWTEHIQNDCLKFAEAMKIGTSINLPSSIFNHLIKDESEPELCIKKSNTLFGESDEANLKIIQKFRRNKNEINNNANPEPGEAYAIVRSSLKYKKKSPFHIAFVVYRENGVNITLEAGADNESNAERAEYYPEFGLYDTNVEGYTFHKRWSGELEKDDRQYKDSLYSDGYTFVLSPKMEIANTYVANIGMNTIQKSKSISNARTKSKSISNGRTKSISKTRTKSISNTRTKRRRKI